MQVGQFVECIDDSPCQYGVNTELHKGRVYTISDIAEEFGTTAVQVAEISCTFVHDDGEIYDGWFRASRFRPLRKLTVDDFMSTREPVDA